MLRGAGRTELGGKSPRETGDCAAGTAAEFAKGSADCASGSRAHGRPARVKRRDAPCELSCPSPPAWPRAQLPAGAEPWWPSTPTAWTPWQRGSGRAAPGRAPQVKLPGSSSETPSRAHLQPRCQRRFSKPLPFTKGEGKERVCRGNSLPITKQRLAICCLERAPAPTARSCVLSDFR